MHKLKRSIAVILAFVISFSVNLSVNAAQLDLEEADIVATNIEALDEKQNVNEIETTDDIEEKIELGKNVNYVYIENPQIKKGETENIVISVGEDTQLLESAMLTLKLPDGEERSILSEKISGNLALFAIEISDIDKLGEYVLSGIEYTLMDINYSEEFEEIWSYLVEDTTYTMRTYESEADESQEGVICSDDAITIESLDQALTAVNEMAFDEGVDVDITRYNRSSSGDLVIVLDPGHDNTHAGAVRGNLKGTRYYFGDC